MSISREDLDRIAELARLEIPPARAEALSLELSAVLTFAEALRQLDLDGLRAERRSRRPACRCATDAPDGRQPRSGARHGRAHPRARTDYFIVPPIVDHVEP